MGSIDSVTHTFKCNACQKEGTVHIVERGSVWSSAWDDEQDAPGFKLVWKKRKSRQDMPLVESAQCTCGNGDVVVTVR